MANVKAKVIKGSVNGVKSGEEISVSSEDFESLENRGFVEKAKATPKPKSKKEEAPKEDEPKKEDEE